MLRKALILASAALLVTLLATAKAQAWGAYHVGYTHYGPYTGFQHYGATGYRGPYGAGYGGVRYGGYGAYGGYRYGGYRYGGYGGYGGYRAGYYRRW
jgi:hypothetical protein